MRNIAIIAGLILIPALVAACTGSEQTRGTEPTNTARANPHEEDMQRDELLALLEEHREEREDLLRKVERLNEQIQEANQSHVARRSRNDICDRSVAVQEELFSEGFHHKQCSFVSDRDLLAVTELSICCGASLKAGDLDGFGNLHTLRLYLGERPPSDLAQDMPSLENFLLEYPSENGNCGGMAFPVNGKPRTIRVSGPHCRLAFGVH